MKQQILRWIALLLGSVANLWNLGILLFMGANLINDLSGSESLSEKLSGIGILIIIDLFLTLSVISIIIAWFKSKIGGFLMIISAIITLFLIHYEEILNGVIWSNDAIMIQVVLLLSGFLLLYYSYNKGLLKKETT